MRTIEIKVYKFDELSKPVQQKILDRMRYDEMVNGWWDPIYEDAANVGIKLEGLLREYSNYLTSDECIKERIEENDYEFKEDGTQI